MTSFCTFMKALFEKKSPTQKCPLKRSIVGFIVGNFVLKYKLGP